MVKRRCVRALGVVEGVIWKAIFWLNWGQPLRAQHLRPLTSLRFFAAGSIVLFHMKDILPWGRPDILSQGVSFFFVLSGFILTHAYGSKFDVKRFYINRFARLWPVHLFCFVLVVFAVNPMPLSVPMWRHVAVANLLMVHSWLPIVGLPFSFNGPSWSISCEMAFYAIFPLLVRTNHFWKIYVGIAIGIALALCFTGEPPIQHDVFDFWPAHFVMQFPLMRLLEFATGVAAGRWFKTAKPPVVGGTAMEIAALLGLACYWLVSHFIERRIPSYAFSHWLGESGGFAFFAAVIVVFGWGAGAISRALANPVLVRLGEISFSTYMLHQIIIRFYLAHDPGLAWPIAAGVIIAAAYAGSYLLWEFIEKPAREAIIGKALGYRIGSADAKNA